MRLSFSERGGCGITCGGPCFLFGYIRDLLFVFHIPADFFANFWVSLFESLFQ